MAIDRRRLVRRHNPVLHSLDPECPLSVGNGELAFTADCTGLQTFPGLYGNGVPLCTQSQWGWHTSPAPSHVGESPLLRLALHDTYGRGVGYATSSDGQEELFDYLRRNPHRLNLGAIGLAAFHESGRLAAPGDMGGMEQELDLWTGILTSRYTLFGIPVLARTACHPRFDAVSIRVESALCASGKLGVELGFPFGSPEIHASDWLSSQEHVTEVSEDGNGTYGILRVMGGTRYRCILHISSGVSVRRMDRHVFRISPAEERGWMEVTFEFTPSSPGGARLIHESVEAESAKQWERFWSDGGCIELSGSADPRAGELERRLVLSQYLTAIQCSGALPPQETGLTCNSWYGKFHLEMHYWHAAHFPLWGREAMLERSLPWYAGILDSAKGRARSQGYDGARWPKMTAPDGIDSPSRIGPLLIWQQPHIITFAELIYRARRDRLTLEKYGDLVFATADFMVSYARLDASGRYVLGPPLIPAQEIHDPAITLNPTFELEYWDFGLRVANAWRRRLGVTEDPRWRSVAEKLAPLPRGTAGGRVVYLAHERCPDTFAGFASDHPSMLAALGMLPGRKADRAVMEATLDSVLSGWDFDSAWGWDFPMIAMTAARLGRRRDAVDVLLMDHPKNTYLANGHNPQRPKRDLPLYLPGNGALLIASGMMAAGWNGAAGPSPGFPNDGSWSVSSEHILPLP